MDLLDELLAPICVWRGPGGKEVRGIAGGKELMAMYLGAFPGIQISIEDQVAEGDRVVTRFTARGIHMGDLFGARSSDLQERRNPLPEFPAGLGLDHSAPICERNHKRSAIEEA